MSYCELHLYHFIPYWTDSTIERERIEVFIPYRTHDPNMSKATKIVLGTVVVAALLAVLQIANMWLA